MASPLPSQELDQIATTACESALGPAEEYMHQHVADWNATIINSIRQSLIDKTSEESKLPAYKYIVNSTIIQHVGSSPEAGKRGMHSATGAFWNTEKDGTFSFKWEPANSKGMDVVISITWIAI